MAKYFDDYRNEVYDIMLDYFWDLDLIRYDRVLREQRSCMVVLLMAGQTDEKIISILTKMYPDLSEFTAKAILKFVKENPNEEDW